MKTISISNKYRNGYFDGFTSILENENEKERNLSGIKNTENVTKVVNLLRLKNVEISLGRDDMRIKGKSDIIGDVISIVLENHVPKRSFESSRDEAKRLYNEGLSQQEIANYLGVSQKTVSNIIKEFRLRELTTKYENTFVNKNDRIGIEVLLLSIGKKTTKKNVEKLTYMINSFWGNGEGTVAAIKDYIQRSHFDDFLAWNTNAPMWY